MKFKVILGAAEVGESTQRPNIVKLGEGTKLEVVMDDTLRKALYQSLSMVVQGSEEAALLSGLKRFMFYTNARVEMKKLAKTAITEFWKGVRTQIKQLKDMTASDDRDRATLKTALTLQHLLVQAEILETRVFDGFDLTGKFILNKMLYNDNDMTNSLVTLLGKLVMSIGIDDPANLAALLSPEALGPLLCRYLTLPSPYFDLMETLIFDEFSERVPMEKQIETYNGLNSVLSPHFPGVMTRILRSKIVQIEFSDGIVLKAIQDALQGLTRNLKELL